MGRQKTVEITREFKDSCGMRQIYRSGRVGAEIAQEKGTRLSLPSSVRSDSPRQLAVQLHQVLVALGEVQGLMLSEVDHAFPQVLLKKKKKKKAFSNVMKGSRCVTGFAGSVRASYTRAPPSVWSDELSIPRGQEETRVRTSRISDESGSKLRH